MNDEAGVEPGWARELDAVRQEARFELQLLHERVNALLAAETFLTIAYTATRASSGAWVALVAPTLSAFGLLLAVLAWPGISATARLVMIWTRRVSDLLEHQRPYAPADAPGAQGDRRRREIDQRRGLLFFRAAPAMLVVLWIVLLMSAIVQRN